MQAQALERGNALLLQKGNALVGETTIQLQYSFPSNGWTVNSPKEITFTPEYRLSWRIASYTQNGGYCHVQLDVTTGDVTGYGFTMLRGKAAAAFVEGGEVGAFLRKASKLTLAPLSAPQNGKRLAAISAQKGGAKTLTASPSPIKFYGALSGLLRAHSLPRFLSFRPTHSLKVNLANGESRTLLFDRRIGYLRYEKVSEKFYLLPGAGLRRWMAL